MIPPEIEDPDQPTDADRVHALQHDYRDLLHALQTGCEYGVGGMVGSPPVGPQVALDRWAEQKHLRVGINGILVELGTLLRLLFDKGVITELEYWTAAVEAFRTEVANYEAELKQRLGVQVRLR